MSRMEEYVEAIITGDNDDLPAPRSEREREFYEAAKRGLGGGGTGGDCDWNIMKNKPFGEETGTKTLADHTGVMVDAGYDAGYARYGYIPATEYIPLADGMQVHLTYTHVTTGYSFDEVIAMSGSSFDFKAVGEDGYSGSYLRISNDDTNQRYKLEEVAMGEGLRETDEIVIKMTIEDKVVKPLDEKYIPETIARKSDIAGGGGGSFIGVFSLSASQDDIDEELGEGTATLQGATYEEIYNALLNQEPIICILWFGGTYGIAETMGRETNRITIIKDHITWTLMPDGNHSWVDDTAGA